MIYTVTLNPALDYVMKVDALRSDDINRSKAETLTYGGKGVNVSVILTRLGIKNKALGFTAGFTGSALERLLEADGIDCDFVRLESGETRINVKIKAETELDINARGPAVSEKDIEALFEKLDELQTGDFLVLAGSVPAALPPDIYERMLKRLDGRSVHFVVDAAGEALLRTLKYKPFLIKPNHLELGDLFGVTAETDAEIERCARELQKRGAQNVLVSRARDGALLLDKNGSVYKIGSVAGTLVNSVGCGDSMVGGFLAGYLQSGSYAAALRLGSACGSATAFSEGLAEAAEISRILTLLNNG